MSRRKRPEDRYTKGTLLSVPCQRANHSIFIHRNGKVIFLDHPGVSLKVLSAEYYLMSPELQATSGCACMAAAQQGRPEGNSLPLWFIRDLEGGAWKRQRERKELAERGTDWLTTGTVRSRLSVPCYKKALHDLNRMKFRTTNTTGHLVAIEEAQGKQTSCVDRAYGMATGTKKKSRRKQYVLLRLNLKQWARVWKYKAGVVEEAFVVRVFKVNCPNELVVDMLHQSTGYQILMKRRIIRRDHAGIWRVHAEVD